MSVHMLPGTGIEEQIPLTDLIDLEEAGFADGALPLRDIDYEYVAQLAEVPAADLPAIQTVRIVRNGEVKQAIIDGYHRAEAADIRGESTVRGISTTHETENSVIIDAFEANLRHGKRTDKGTRTAYAMWLYSQADHEKYSLRDIAKMAHIAPSTLSTALKKAAAAAEIQEQEPDGNTQAEVSAAKKLFTSLHKFYAEERSLLGMFGNGDSQRDVKHRAKSIYNHVATLNSDKQQEALKEIASLYKTLDAFIEMLREEQSQRTKKAAAGTR